MKIFYSSLAWGEDLQRNSELLIRTTNSPSMRCVYENHKILRKLQILSSLEHHIDRNSKKIQCEGHFENINSASEIHKVESE